MPDVLNAPSTKFPKTVSACHAEIIRLRNAAGDGKSVRDLQIELDDANARIEKLETEAADLNEQIEELESAAEARKEPEAAIETFLFEVERPTGQFKFDVVHGPSCDRAILGLYDAVGRNP